MSENNVSRYKEREQAFFLCFEKLFNDDSISDISEVALESRDDDYSQFAIDCARGVQENIEEIDEIIKSHLSKKWRLERINKVSARRNFSATILVATVIPRKMVTRFARTF